MTEHSDLDEYDSPYFDKLEGKIAALEKKQLILFAGITITLGYSVLQAKMVRNLMTALTEIASQQNEIVGILNAGPGPVQTESNPMAAEPVYSPNGYDPGPQDIPEDVKRDIEQDAPGSLFRADPDVI